MKKRLKGQDMRDIELFVEQPKAGQHSAFLRAVIDPPPLPLLHASSSTASQHSALLRAATGSAAPDACVQGVQNGMRPKAHRYIYYIKSLYCIVYLLHKVTV